MMDKVMHLNKKNVNNVSFSSLTQKEFTSLEEAEDATCSLTEEGNFHDEDLSDDELSWGEEGSGMNVNSRHSRKIIWVLILSALCISWAATKNHDFNQLEGLVAVKLSDSRLSYGGRWLPSTGIGGEQTKRADWPCSDIRFDVKVDKEGASLPFIWYGLRTRVRVTVSAPEKPEDISFQTVFQGPSFMNDRLKSDITFPEKGRYTVRVRKISTSAPYGTGVGDTLLGGSMIDFVGLGKGQNLSVLQSAPKTRSIVAIGASDTAGWCVDGNPSQSAFDYTSAGWLYEDCGSTYAAKLANKFDANLSVQAIAGIGMGQNAMSRQKWQLGSLTMPDYFPRTLRSTSGSWDFSTKNPDIVMVSLGGNDFNHQDGNVPTNNQFTSQYENFLLSLFQAYDKADRDDQKPTHFVSICGMGDPLEADRDPDNNRCKPCQHVKASVESFKKKLHPDLAQRLHYVDIPCDGSVVKGIDDIGCDGHKNSLGQQRIADFLGPKLSTIAGWN